MNGQLILIQDHYSPKVNDLNTQENTVKFFEPQIEIFSL